MKKEHKRAPSYRALRWRLGLFVLALWLAAMGLLTWAVAADMQYQLKAEVQKLVARYGAHDVNPGAPSNEPLAHWLMRRPSTPYAYISIRPLLPFVLPQHESISSDDALWGRWDLYYGFEAGELFHEAGDRVNIIAQTKSTIAFAFYTKSNWEQQVTDTVRYGYAYLPKEAEQIASDFPQMMHFSLLYDVVRMQGHFEGDRFIPASIDTGNALDMTVTSSTDPDMIRRLMQLDRSGSIVWYSQYAAPQIDPDAVTIYCTNVASYTSPLQPVEINGQRYSDITEAYLSGNFGESDSLLCTRLISKTPISQDGQSLYYTVLIRAWPLEYALRRLWPTYLVSAFLVLLGLVLLNRRIRRSLTTPLSQMTQWALADVDKAWQEPYALQQMLTDTRQSLAETKTKLQQTQTALEYAQNAEQSRKMLVSSIAHELKTPLAVIHSYAEGLQAGIAPDRQAEYLSVILGQSERMDEMVLQTLELSRLEAGKVQLATERLRLLKLTEAVVDKLAPLAEAKELTFQYPLAEDMTVMADEGRLEQVLTNLIGNAIKYSPQGGTILIKLFREGSRARFKVQNAAPHLSDEALERVWDSFYRADPSRTEPGTGIGLSLVKAIVELHRGSCTVRNITSQPGDVLPTGVEFGFALPLD